MDFREIYEDKRKGDIKDIICGLPDNQKNWYFFGHSLSKLVSSCEPYIMVEEFNESNFNYFVTLIDIYINHIKQEVTNMVKKLFESLDLRNMTFKNRIVMALMCIFTAKEDGIVTDWYNAHYESFFTNRILKMILDKTIEIKATKNILVNSSVLNIKLSIKLPQKYIASIVTRFLSSLFILALILISIPLPLLVT